VLPTDNGIKVAGVLEKLAGGAVGDSRLRRQYARTSHSADPTASAPNARHNYLGTTSAEIKGGGIVVKFPWKRTPQALVSFRVCYPGTAE
jgi:hypothetical protein